MFNLPVTYTNELNDKKYAIGDIVYFVDPWKHEWDWGVVEDHYSNGYGLGLYEFVDSRTIDGIPIKEYPFEEKRHKLPKGWSYDTQLFITGRKPIGTNLFMIGFNPNGTIAPNMEYTNKEGKHISWYSNDMLKQMIDDGVFVKPSTQFTNSYPVSDITKDGWTVKLEHHKESRSDYATVYSKYCYPTLEAALAEIEAYKAELKRQAELSDYDWSVEQIDKTLNRANWLDDEYKAHCRKWLLEQNDVEDIVTRAVSNGIEWKYDRNKKWMVVV